MVCCSRLSRKVSPLLAATPEQSQLLLQLLMQLRSRLVVLEQATADSKPCFLVSSRPKDAPRLEVAENIGLPQLPPEWQASKPDGAAERMIRR